MSSFLRDAINKRQEEIAKDQSIKSLSDSLFSKNTKKVKEIPLDQIEVSIQVRHTFVDSEIEQLAQSIKEHGQIQPITVHAINSSNRYKLICGEKRYRACKLLGSTTIVAYIISEPKTEEERLSLQIIENMHRSDPPIFEIAAAIGLLNEKQDVSQFCQLISCEKTYGYSMLQFNKLTDDEKVLFKNLPKAFFRNYIALKKISEDDALAIIKAVKSNQPYEMIASALIKRLEGYKNKDSKSANGNRTKQQNLSFSFQKLGKIKPDLSKKCHSYLKDHQSVELQDLVTRALKFYLDNQDLVDDEPEEVFSSR